MQTLFFALQTYMKKQIFPNTKIKNLKPETSNFKLQT